MGGRGASSAARGGIRAESNAQFSDAKRYAERAGATAVRYTDHNGTVLTAVKENGEWRDKPITQTGRIYNAAYSADVANYAKMSTADLQSELKKQQSISNENYWGFTRKAASMSGSSVSAMSQADVNVKHIQQVLRRRK